MAKTQHEITMEYTVSLVSILIADAQGLEATEVANKVRELVPACYFALQEAECEIINQYFIHQDTSFEKLENFNR